MFICIKIKLHWKTMRKPPRRFSTEKIMNKIVSPRQTCRTIGAGEINYRPRLNVIWRFLNWRPLIFCYRWTNSRATWRFKMMTFVFLWAIILINISQLGYESNDLLFTAINYNKSQKKEFCLSNIKTECTRVHSKLFHSNAEKVNQKIPVDWDIVAPVEI